MVTRERRTPIRQYTDKTAVGELFCHLVLHNEAKPKSGFSRAHDHGDVVEGERAVDTYPQLARVLLQFPGVETTRRQQAQVDALVTGKVLWRARRRVQPLWRALLGYGTLLRDPAILAYIGAGGFFYGGKFAFIAGSPFAYVTYHHVSPQTYGLLFGLSVVGIMAANLINAGVVVRLGADRLLRWGTLGAAAAGLLLAAMARTGWGGLWGLVLPLFAFASATGFIVANSIANALARRPDRAGAVSALVGAAQYGAGIASSALVGAFADGTPWPMGWVIAAAGLGSALSGWALSRRSPDPSL